MIQIKRELSLNGQVLFRTSSEALLGQNGDLLLQSFYLLHKRLILLLDNSGLFGKKPEIFTLLKEQLVEVLGTLTPREEKVLRLRFGIEDGRTRTLEEVGKEFNVTRERIRQIEAKALRKLRHPSRSKKLKDFLD